MKNMPKSIQKAFLLVSAMSALATQGIFASQIASGIALADNEREREREKLAHNIGKWILAILANLKILILTPQNLSNKIKTLLS